MVLPKTKPVPVIAPAPKFDVAPPLAEERVLVPVVWLPWKSGVMVDTDGGAMQLTHLIVSMDGCRVVHCLHLHPGGMLVAPHHFPVVRSFTSVFGRFTMELEWFSSTIARGRFDTLAVRALVFAE